MASFRSEWNCLEMTSLQKLEIHIESKDSSFSCLGRLERIVDKLNIQSYTLAFIDDDRSRRLHFHYTKWMMIVQFSSIHWVKQTEHFTPNLKKKNTYQILYELDSVSLNTQTAHGPMTKPVEEETKTNTDTWWKKRLFKSNFKIISMAMEHFSKNLLFI